MAGCRAVGAVKVENSGSGNLIYVGGLGGYNNGTLYNSYATAAVHAGGTDAGGISLGGLAGYHNGKIYNSYATGAVTNTANAIDYKFLGTLVGWNTGGGTFSNCHAPASNGHATKAVGTGSTTGITTSGTPGSTVRTAQTSEAIRTTEWQKTGNVYGIIVVNRQFYTEDVWMNGDKPDIDFEDNGRE